MRVLLAACVLLAATSLSASAGETHGYIVLRDGEPVGVQSVTFHRTDAGLEVSVRWKVAVSFAGITLYRFEHQRVERWVDGVPVSFRGRTHDDGTDYEVSYECGGDGCIWIVNGESRLFPSGVMPATVWNRAVLGHESLISPVDNDLYRLSAKAAGRQTVETGEGPVEAELIQVRGSVERDLWYDDADRLVKMRFRVRDSTVELVRDRITDVQTARDRPK